MDALDAQQRRLITAWLELAPADEYGRFMSTWIAFNALCYALFASEASQRRAELADSRGLNGLAGEVRAEGQIEVRVDGRVSIRLETPGRIRIDIREKYTENFIFSAFSSKFQQDYTSWLQEPQFLTKLTNFLAAIRQPRGNYGINMLRIDKHDVDRDPVEMAALNIVVAITDRANLAELVGVLYQVRNNTFHGEKVPRDPNDDESLGRRAARPVLEDLVRRAYDPVTEPPDTAEPSQNSV
jgi:hypothetical protein